jgi:hypothetical protein
VVRVSPECTGSESRSSSLSLIFKLSTGVKRRKRMEKKHIENKMTFRIDLFIHARPSW